MPRGIRILRAALAGLVFALLALSLPGTAIAAPRGAVLLAFDVVGVKKGESVTIRTRDFPLRTQFNVLIDVVGKQAAGGQPAGEFFSDKGGVIEQTFAIPEALRGELILAIRVESKDGYLATNWFINQDMAYKPKDKNIKPEIAFGQVKKNQTVTVQGKNFPPGYTFSVRAGPYYTFYRDYVFADSVKSNADGTLSFSLALPAKAKDSDYIMVRLDGAGVMAYNNFQNVDGGSAVPASKLYKFQWCQVVATRPVGELAPGEEFDAVWTIQNTSNLEWAQGTVDYKWAGGEEMQKYAKRFDLDWTVPRAAVFDIAVDLVAPDNFAGWHTTTWALMFNETEMCRMKISAFVKDR